MIRCFLGLTSRWRWEIFPTRKRSSSDKTRFDHKSATLRRCNLHRSAHEPDPVAHAGETHPRPGLAVQPAAIVRHAHDEAGKRRITQVWRLTPGLELQRRADPRGAGVLKRVGHRLLYEAISHQAGSLAQGFDARVYVE